MVEAEKTEINFRQEVNEPGKAKKFEKCIFCGRRLTIDVNTQIDYRAFYIEGAGQLCYDCYHKIYK